jgi:hypothetical protein
VKSDDAVPSRTHYLKTWPGPFAAVLDGSKRFEFRRNDRDFRVGDVLSLQEYDPAGGGNGLGAYTDRCADYVVTYLLTADDGSAIPTGYVVMSIREQAVRPVDHLAEIERLRAERDAALERVGLLIERVGLLMQPPPDIPPGQERFPWEMMRLWCANRDEEKRAHREEIARLEKEIADLRHQMSRMVFDEREMGWG